MVSAAGEDSNATGVDGNQADNGALDAGAAYVFVRSGATWSQQAYLKASNTNAGDQFGISTAVLGDTLVVGAWREDSSATGVNGNQADDTALWAGAAYVFTRSGATWSQQAYLKASNTESGDNFGVFVSVSGDTVVVGSPNEDSNATGVNGNEADNSATTAGAVYVFDLDQGPVAYCFGDGSGTSCPCGNAGAPGNGCASSVNTAGANLASSGTASLSADTLALLGTGMPNGSALYFQGTTQAAGGSGAAFGDGLRCAGGSTIRLSPKTNVGGASQFPTGGDPSVSVQGQVSAPGVRTYQCWYRNAAAFCQPQTFNLTNALQVTWSL